MRTCSEGLQMNRRCTFRNVPFHHTQVESRILESLRKDTVGLISLLLPREQYVHIVRLTLPSK